MLATELIKCLQESIGKYGDKDVYFIDADTEILFEIESLFNDLDGDIIITSET